MSDKAVPTHLADLRPRTRKIRIRSLDFDKEQIHIGRIDNTIAVEVTA